jgi:hypothetical protein
MGIRAPTVEWDDDSWREGAGINPGPAELDIRIVATSKFAALYLAVFSKVGQISVAMGI